MWESRSRTAVLFIVSGHLAYRKKFLTTRIRLWSNAETGWESRPGDIYRGRGLWLSAITDRPHKHYTVASVLKLDIISTCHKV